MRWICAIACLCAPLFCASQTPFTKTANDAFVITRMVHKFHVQPRAIDDSLSSNIFTQFFNILDPHKTYFTKEDILHLTPFARNLDDAIQQKQTTFLQQALAIYKRRLLQGDSIIENVCKKPLDFTIAEVYTASDDSSFADNDIDLKSKLTKLVKKSVLLTLLEGDVLTSLPPARQKAYVDSAQASLRKKISNRYKRSLQRKMDTPGGLEELVGTAYCKAIAQCFDPHTVYMPATEKEDFETEIGNKLIGFGFALDEDEEGRVSISKLVAGSPAFKSGQLNEGDKIEAIEWEGNKAIDVSVASIDEVNAILSASNHHQATVKVKKADGSSRQVKLWKEQLNTSEEDEELVKSYILKGKKNVGYISLPAFYSDWENDEANINGCANDVAKEIVKLKKENIEGLILDVRFNGGGSMLEAIELAGIFIDGGPVGMIKSKEEKAITLKDVNRGTIYDGPLFLMINGHSASASEMLAATLQDYNRAVLVGTPTYGKATAQSILPMDTTISRGSDVRTRKTDTYLKTTTSFLYRVNGNSAQAASVQPDVLLPDVLDAMQHRESDYPFALRLTSIEGNKYYRPNPPLAFTDLKAAAKNIVDTSAFFAAVNAYTNKIKASKQVKPFPLKLSDAVSWYNAPGNDDPDLDVPTLAPYSVLNNSYELQRMAANTNLAAVNDEWKQTISQDPYIQAVYQLLLLTIK